MGMLREGNRGDGNVKGGVGEKCSKADRGGFRDKNGNDCGEHVYQKEGGTQADV